MDVNTAALSTSANFLPTTNLSPATAGSSSVASIGSPELRTIMSSNGVTISGEAQYLFEMDVYLQLLNKDDQFKAVEFLSNSNNPLHAKALQAFYQGEEARSKITDEVIRSIRAQSEAIEATRLKVSVRDPALGPEIAVLPNGTDIFRLDGQKNYYPYQANTTNTTTKARLDALEADAPSSLNIQEKANIFGTVRNAVYSSTIVQQSFDDVLHFNYMLEKARTTINHTNAPDDLKVQLNNILSQAVKDQNDSQTNYWESIKKYANDGRVGAEVRDNIRKATAAQEYNKELQGILSTTKMSVLSAGAVMTKLLTKHTDLIRFSPSKINEALAFYQKDFDVFDDFVRNGYRPPEEKKIEYDTTPLTEGHNYASSVIDEIKHYIS